ncbi:hypothetical protein AB0J48_27990 [Nocardia salmonicida]|uniref:hypothetical protein n=1 Tax=Nocardia salmonicida TaxID=53431 RepID=UPI003428C12A
MFGIRYTSNLPLQHPTSEQLEQDIIALVSLRRLLQRLTTALGSLVALSTLALGASVLMTKNPAKELVVVFGAGGSILVGAFYVPAAAVLRGRGERLSAAIFAATAPMTTTELVEGTQHVVVVQDRGDGGLQAGTVDVARECDSSNGRSSSNSWESTARPTPS